MFNNNNYLHCDRCKFFISNQQRGLHDGFCPKCGERLRKTTSYDLDEVESRKHLFRQCNRCESIFHRIEKCLMCKTNIKLIRVR